MKTEKIKLFGNNTVNVFTERPDSIGEILKKTVKLYGNKEAILFENEKISYLELEEKSERLAGFLQVQFGIVKGDRVATIVGNRIEFPVLVFACLKLGAIMVPINVKLKASEVGYILTNSQPKAIILEDSYLETLESSLENDTQLRINKKNIMIIDSKASMNLAEAFSSNFPVQKEKIKETDPAFILYTSGTTGNPKGAMLSHVGIIHSIMHYQNSLATDNSTRTLIAVPIYHVTGLIGQLLHMVYVGGTSVILKRYQNDQYIRQSYDFKINFHFNVPTIFIMMATSPLLKDLSFDFVKTVAFGGSPIYQNTFKTLQKIFPNASLHNVYGATETSSPTTIMPLSYPSSKVSSVGIPVETAELKIVDDHKNVLPPNQIGELLIKGPMVIEGYWNNREANETSFFDGYWCSGDVAKMDEDGYFYILDRKKDMINRGGEKIFSIEVENVLNSHPEIKQAAVVPSADAIFGEKVKAYIVSDMLTIDDQETIRSYCTNYLAKYKIPEIFEFVNELPQNAAGKVLKQLLK